MFRDLLLGTTDESLKTLQDIIADRIEEGMGEAVFELGYENNGDSMQLTLTEWNTALERLKKAGEAVGSHCEVLLTKNVGGDVEAASTADGTSKDKAASGKILIRRVPPTTEDVIETRIAVVGNGERKRCPALTTTNNMPS